MQVSLRKSPRLTVMVLLTSTLGFAPFAHAEMRPSLNMYGATGLIDMPSGEAQPDGQLSISASQFGPIRRNTLSFQITPRLSASFRFLGIRDWNQVARAKGRPLTGVEQFDTYYDRSFDLRFKALDETRFLPSVTIGLQDFAGTGVLSGEYVAATKTLTPNLKVTAGLGWGRLGSEGNIGSPLGIRPPIVVGFGGNFNAKQWFRGPAAPFGGVEWQINDQWTVKAEYSSDKYVEEAGTRGTFAQKGPVNLGVEYQPNDYFRLGAYYMYGNTVGIGGHLFINPKKRPMGGVTDSAPALVNIRPNRAGNETAYSPVWVAQTDAAPILRNNLALRLQPDGIVVDSIGYTTGDSVQVRIRNTRYLNNAQAIGRTARALSHVMPASVEQFEIVPMANGIAASKITLRRADLENLEFDADASTKMAQRITVSGDTGSAQGFNQDPDLYPRFTWSLAPTTRLRFFDQTAPFKGDVGVRATGRFELRPGLVIASEVTQRLAGNLSDRPPLPDRGKLQAVRSAVYFYDRDGGTAIEKLALDWNVKLAQDVYARASAGYLERMFGGISTEVLWKPAGSRWALGAELNYVKQRAPDQKFGFALPAEIYATDSGPKAGPASYTTLGGHVSAYYEIGQGFHAQLDVGKYLAGDIGATFSLDREFANGWRVGAFATKTNVSAADFGSGSFDKGIRVVIPLNWGLGTPTRSTTPFVLRPFRRDGGAKLEIDNRLYETVRGYHARELDNQFGRFWK
ncbi:Exopolysaccharide biosynthesis protein YbjH [Pseudorhodobacter antarcticus]|uniref:Exopolysaccharide biosynthesis protein YbjH n=1 Tax=Pseudorhodobacter antarcticus TaxID=1077947 RepID=A0A1H8E935_9RHOB|nr:YjbH domain-containing protein [Pseudorhodobacter antarcticus]SEN15634.1 Exopolysaccharide biosynthesis protein YbjH [Pseudorhodobacter antarcticus]